MSAARAPDSDNDEDGDDDDMILLEQCVERLVTVHVPGSGAVRAAALTYADGIVSENSGNIVYTAQHRRPDHFKALLFNVQPGAEAPEINLIDPVPCVVHSVLRQSVLNTADSKRSDNCLAFDVAQSRLTYSSMTYVDTIVEEIRVAIRETARTPDKHIVLHGHSRGAAAMLIAVTCLDPPEQERISLVVAEGIFDDVQGIVERRYGSAVATVIKCVRWACTNDNPWRDPTPLEAASVFPLTVPVVFFVGGRDQVCSPDGVAVLVRQLCQRGHKKCRVIVLPNSGHLDMPTGPDSEMYRSELFRAYREVFDA